MGRNDGAEGLVEAAAIRALAAGQRYDETKMGAWRRGLGPERMETHRPISQQIPVVCRATAFELGDETAEDWLSQWAADQLSGFTGLDGIEPGWCHYGAFTRGVIARAAHVALARGRLDLAALLRQWLRVAMAWMELADCLPVGHRCQGHFDDVTSTQLCLARGQYVGRKRLQNQTYYWPAAVMASAAGIVPLTWDAADLAAVRVRARFEVRRFEGGIWAAMLREPGEQWNPNGAPSYAAYRINGGPATKLEIDPARQPRPATCRVHQVGPVLVATATHEAGGDAHELRLDTAPLGRLLSVARVPVVGRIVLDTMPPQTDPAGPW